MWIFGMSLVGAIHFLDAVEHEKVVYPDSASSRYSRMDLRLAWSLSRVMQSYMRQLVPERRKRLIGVPAVFGLNIGRSVAMKVRGQR
jgi:hypothetical protein